MRPFERSYRANGAVSRQPECPGIVQRSFPRGGDAATRFDIWRLLSEHWLTQPRIVRQFARIALVVESGTFVEGSRRKQASEKCLLPESPCRIGPAAADRSRNNHENPHVTYRGFSKLPRE